MGGGPPRGLNMMHRRENLVGSANFVRDGAACDGRLRTREREREKEDSRNRYGARLGQKELGPKSGGVCEPSISDMQDTHPLEPDHGTYLPQAQYRVLLHDGP